MKYAFKKSLLLCLAAALCCAGCAKHEMVKQDEMIPVTTTATSTPLAPAKAVVPEEAKTATKDALPSSLNESQAGNQAAKAAAAAKAKDASLQTALDKVFFDFDSYTLSPAARATLAKNAEILKQQANLKVKIEGNCDELGSDDYNLALGENRAKTALNYLQSLGIQSSRLSVISYGKEKPANPGHDEAARANNRRDEFVITAR